MSTTDARAAARTFLRDFVTDGVPASGANEPAKREGRAALTLLADAVDAAAAVANTAASGRRSAAGGSVRFRTTANVNLASALINGATFDGVVAATGDRVLVGSQSAPAQNGIYPVVASGATTRATDADTAADLDRIEVYVREGTTGAAQTWHLPLEAADITVGSTALNFVLVNDNPDLAALQEQVFDGGNLIESLRPVLGLGTGASASASGRGYSIALGQIGNGTIILFNRYLAAPEGRTYQFLLGIRTSATFTRRIFPGVNVELAAGGASVNRGVAVITETDTTVGAGTVVGDYRYFIVEYEFEGDEAYVNPYIAVSSALATGGIETAEAVEVRETVVAVEPGGIGVDSIGGKTADERTALVIARTIGLPGYNPSAEAVKVMPTGGDFDNVLDAMAAITATVTEPVLMEVHDGLDPLDAELVIKDFVEVRGVGPLGTVELYLNQPDNVSAVDIEANSAVRLGANGKISNIVVRGRNCRYGIHWESSGTRPFTRSQIDGCIVIHEGNADADNEASWSADKQYAVGSGASDGEQKLITNTLCIGPAGGLTNHPPAAAGGYRNATYFKAENCNFMATTAASAGFRISMLTTGPGCTCELNGNTFGGAGILYTDNGWASADTTTSRAQVAVFGRANKGAAFRSSIGGGGAAGPLYRPFFSDEEQTCWNDSGSTINRKTVLAWADDGRLKVRKMTSGDAASLFAGVAIEDIANGACKRVKTSGLLDVTADVLTTGSLGAAAIGSTFSLSATAGTASLGGSQGLLTVTRVVSGVITVRVA